MGAPPQAVVPVSTLISRTVSEAPLGAAHHAGVCQVTARAAGLNPTPFPRAQPGSEPHS